MADPAPQQTEQSAEPQAPPPPPQEAAPPNEPERSVPYDRFKEVNDRLREAEKWREERESQDLSEAERERKARERAERERDEATERAQTTERSGWVRDAAQLANFHAPADALAHVDMSGVEDERAAKRAVKDLAERSPHLVRPVEPARPQVGQVLRDGQQPVQGPQAAEEDPRAALGGQIQDFLASRR
jgi:hypothetical protein